MLAEPNTPEGDRLDVLVTLVEAYELKHFPMQLPDAVAAIEYAMERNDLTVKDLAVAMVGPIVSTRFSTESDPSLRMITALHEMYGIPAESLLKQRV